MASLGLVSPGEATDGVTPIFLKKTDDLFCSSLSLFGFHSGVTPWRVSTRTFFNCPISFFPLIFVNTATVFFLFGCHPLEGVTRDGLLVTPLASVWRARANGAKTMDLTKATHTTSSQTAIPWLFMLSYRNYGIGVKIKWNECLYSSIRRHDGIRHRGVSISNLVTDTFVRMLDCIHVLLSTCTPAYILY